VLDQRLGQIVRVKRINVKFVSHVSAVERVFLLLLRPVPPELVDA
jgi:hypothetical protein